MFLPKADPTPAPPLVPRSIGPSAIRSFLLLICCFAAARSFGQTPQPDNPPGKISGAVINAVTKAPIPRALVFSTDQRFAMLADGEGHFEFTPPDNGRTGIQGTIASQSVRFGGNCSWLRARKPGFLDDCDEPRAASKSPADDHTIALVPESLISGRVTLPDNDRLFGARVQLFSREVHDGLPRWIPTKAAITNSAGEFRFYELRAGEYKLLMHERGDNDPVVSSSANSYGYPPVYYPNAPDFAGAATIHLAAGESVEADLSAVRQQYYRVTIPVSNGDTNSGLIVNVQAPSGPGFSLGYNVAAKRIEGLLPTGNYMVVATAFGDHSASGTVNLKVNAVATEGPTMTLVPDSSITLDVKEEFTDTSWGGGAFLNDGRRTFTLRGPRAYLNARLENVDNLLPARGGSLRPPNGPNDPSIVLENVPPGHYWLQLNTSRGYLASARMGDVDLLHQPLVVAAGASAPVEIEMRDDTAEIDGTVSGLPPSAGAESQPTGPQAWIYCVPLPDSAGQFQELTVSEGGRFTQTMMAPGDYRLLAFASPQSHLPYRDSEAMKLYETKGPVVHLTAGQKISVEVPLISDNDLPEE